MKNEDFQFSFVWNQSFLTVLPSPCPPVRYCDSASLVNSFFQNQIHVLNLICAESERVSWFEAKKKCALIHPRAKLLSVGTMEAYYAVRTKCFTPGTVDVVMT